MPEITCLDNNFSTTRKLVREQPPKFTDSAFRHPSKKQGGLRLKGYYKKSYPNNPLITLVTVVANDPKGLERTIKNVLGQTYDNIDYIIIDGASDDSTLEVIKRYEDRIDYWLSEPDNGIYDAMNKGIDLATGIWTNFMNADDCFYENDTVEKVVNISPNDADLIYGHTYFCGGDFRGVVKAWDINILWKTMIFTHQSLFTKTTILKKHKFNTNFKISSDYELIFSSYMKGLKFFNSDVVISYFSPGFSEVSRARMAKERWDVVRQYCNSFQVHWFYLSLILKRFFRDIFHKFTSSPKSKRNTL